MSSTSCTGLPDDFRHPVASFYSRSSVLQRVRLPLLLGITVAGFVLYSHVVAPTGERLAVLVGITVAGVRLWDQRSRLSADR